MEGGRVCGGLLRPHDLLFHAFYRCCGFLVPFSVQSLQFHSQYKVCGSILSTTSLVPFSVQSVWFHSQYKVFGSILSTKSLVPVPVKSAVPFLVQTFLKKEHNGRFEGPANWQVLSNGKVGDHKACHRTTAWTCRFRMDAPAWTRNPNMDVERQHER